MFVWMKLWNIGVMALKFHWHTLLFTQSEKKSRNNYLPRDGLSF